MAKRIAAKGKERAKQFSWKQCARETLEVYLNVHLEELERQNAKKTKKSKGKSGKKERKGKKK